MIYLYITIAWVFGHFALEWIIWKLPISFYMDVGSKILSFVLWALTMTYFNVG